MDARKCADTLKPSKQVFLSRKSQRRQRLLKCSHVEIFSARFNDLLWRGLCVKESRSLHNCYRLSVGRFSLQRALYAIAFSVLDVGVMYLWPWV